MPADPRIGAERTARYAQLIPKGQWGMDGRLPRFELAKPARASVSQALKGLSVLIASPSSMVRDGAARQIEVSGGRTVCVSSLPRNADGHDAVLLDRALFADG